MANRQFNINFNSLNKVNAKIRYVTSAIYDKDWSSIMHSHPFTELFYVTKGEGKFHIEDKFFDVKEDDMIIVNANVTHAESSKNNQPFEYIVLGIDDISIITDSSENHNYYSIYNYVDYKHEILFYLKTLLIEASNKSEYYESIIQNILEILIINIIRRNKNKLTLNSTKEVNQNCEFIKKYLEDNYLEDINLDMLCKKTYMNKYYIVHSFKKYLGKTPIAYLNEFRLNKAANLLTSTDYSIAQITTSIGMNNQSYFSQAFKKMFNISPIEYRLKNKK